MTNTLLQTVRENRLSYLLMGGHICVDICQGGLAAALPFLIAACDYTYAEATLLIFMSNVASAVIQPLFGWLGDRKPRPWFMALGGLLAGLGMAGLGVFGNYWIIATSAMISGMGVAMLHPEGGRLANLVAQHSKEGGVSIFSVGGQIGFCLGPIITATACSLWGIRGLLIYLVFCVPYAILLLTRNARLAAFGLQDKAAIAATDGHDHWGSFSLVLTSLSMRSIVYYGITSFVPLFMIAFFAFSESEGSLVVSLFALAGAVATILSSKAAEKTGTPRLMVLCFAATILLVLAFTFSPSAALCCAVVMLLAFAVNLFNPPAIALGQGFVPHHLGMASGLTFGVAVCVGGVVEPLLGLLGDAQGLQVVMLVVAGVAAFGLVLSCFVARAVKRSR